MFISETCGCGINYVAVGGGPFYMHWTMYTVVVEILMIDGIYMLTRQRPN